MTEQDLPVPEQFDADMRLGSGYTQPTGPRPELRPWHRPRKQYIRERQWVNAAKEIVIEMGTDAPLTYLGLPGTDLLDLRMLQALCAENGNTLRYLGFNEIQHAEDSDAVLVRNNEDALRRRGFIDRESKLLPDNIVDLSIATSMGRTVAESFTSFDIVNLDFCGSILADHAGSLQSMYTAIESILFLQARRERPWSLLITGCFDRGALGQNGEEAATRLIASLANNIRNCAAESLIESIIQTGRPLPEVMTFHDLPPSKFAKVLLLAFVLWLRSIGVHQREAKYKFVSCFCYRITSGAEYPQMFSVALKIAPRPHHTPDAAGLLPSVDELNMCEDLKQFISRVLSLKDIDDLLSSDPELMAAMRESTENLLSELNYDVEAYRDSIFSQGV